jgi:hypothetical protein
MESVNCCDSVAGTVPAHAAGKMPFFSVILWFCELCRILACSAVAWGDCVMSVNICGWIFSRLREKPHDIIQYFQNHDHLYGK